MIFDRRVDFLQSRLGFRRSTAHVHAILKQHIKPGEIHLKPAYELTHRHKPQNGLPQLNIIEWSTAQRTALRSLFYAEIHAQPLRTHHLAEFQ